MRTCVAPGGCRDRGTVDLPEGSYCHRHADRLADALARAVVKDRDGNICRRCGDKRVPTEWAHVLARRVAPFLRWDPDNAVALCSACHGEFTLHPDRWWDWLGDEAPGLVGELRRREARAEHAQFRPGVDAVIADLRLMLGRPA
jgi:hypothetical protein